MVHDGESFVLESEAGWLQDNDRPLTLPPRTPHPRTTTIPLDSRDGLEYGETQ